MGRGKVEIHKPDSHFSTAQNSLRRKEKTAVYTKLLTHPFSTFNLDFSATQIDISMTSFIPQIVFNVDSFNGFRFYDPNGTVPDILGVSINGSSNLVGFTPSRLSFDSNNVFVNLQGLTFFGPTSTQPVTHLYLDVDLSPLQPLPEPGTITLFACAAASAVLTSLLRRRRR